MRFYYGGSLNEWLNMPVPWLRAHHKMLDTLLAEQQLNIAEASMIPHMTQGSRNKTLQALRARLTDDALGEQKYDEHGNLILNDSMSVRKWFASIGWGNATPGWER